MEILAIVGSPQKGGRSVTAARAVLGGAAELDSHVSLLELASSPAPEAVQQAMQASDAIVFASPTYRARCSAQLKLLLEQTERGFYSETTSPLQGKAAAIVATGASPHHFLAVDDLRSVLAGFFAVQVLSPGLYFSPDAFLDPTSSPRTRRVSRPLTGVPWSISRQPCAHRVPSKPCDR
jgi:FMN reductase